jgi:hypothetical protein
MLHGAMRRCGLTSGFLLPFSETRKKQDVPPGVLLFREEWWIVIEKDEIFHYFIFPMQFKPMILYYGVTLANFMCFASVNKIKTFFTAGRWFRPKNNFLVVLHTKRVISTLQSIPVRTCGAEYAFQNLTEPASKVNRAQHWLFIFLCSLWTFLKRINNQFVNVICCPSVRPDKQYLNPWDPWKGHSLSETEFV